MALLESSPEIVKKSWAKSGIANAQVIDVHSLHKSGTMFLYRFFKKLAELQSMRFVSENDPSSDESASPYLAGIPDDIDAGQVLCRAPIRSFELDQTRLDGTTQKRIFHVRDPRDILVSEYFSFGWIHPDKQSALTERRNQIQEMSVDEYVIRQADECTWPLNEKYQPLEDYRFDPQLDLVVKYEQMVCSFYRWCHQVVRFAGVRNPTWLALRLTWKYRNEFRVSSEAMKHKRRITPGDHKDKLRPQTIKLLNERFETILRRFDYLK